MTEKKEDKFEFVIIPKRLLLNDKLPGQAKILLGYLRFRQYGNQTAFPSYRKIQDDTGIKIERIKELAERCIDEKLLTVWWGKGQNGANLYAVHLHPADEKMWQKWIHRTIDIDKKNVFVETETQSTQGVNHNGVNVSLTPESEKIDNQSNQDVTPTLVDESITRREIDGNYIGKEESETQSIQGVEKRRVRETSTLVDKTITRLVREIQTEKKKEKQEKENIQKAAFGGRPNGQHQLAAPPSPPSAAATPPVKTPYEIRMEVEKERLEMAEKGRKRFTAKWRAEHPHKSYDDNEPVDLGPQPPDPGIKE
jgi:hypothetical protein